MQNILVLSGVVGFVFGIGLATLHHSAVPFILFLFLLSAGFFLAWFFGKRDLYLVPSVILFCVAIGCLRVLFAPHVLPPPFVSLLDTPSVVEGRVVSDPDVRETNQRVTLRIERGGSEVNVLVVTERFPSLSYGDQLRVSGSFTKPEPFATDGGREFAYDRFLARDDIFLISSRAHIERIGSTTSLLTQSIRFLFEIKHFFAQGLENALPEPHASLAEGLLIGGKQGLGASLLEAFTIAGLLPIIVLSGYNVMLVADGVLRAFAFLPKRRALVLAGVTILLFILASGAGSSAVRAGLMACIALFARATGRTYDALRGLVFVLVVMLLQNPLVLLADPGFQFSFVATLGLILLTDPLSMYFSSIRSAFFREIFATTLAAQFFVLPILLYQTGNFSLVAIPANLLVLPVVPFTMLVSFIAGLMGSILPIVAPISALPAYALLSYIVFVAEALASLPFAHMVIPAFSWSILALLYGGVAWATWALRKKTSRTKSVVRDARVEEKN